MGWNGDLLVGDGGCMRNLLRFRSASWLIRPVM